MFDNVGRDLDEEANKRRAASLGITVLSFAAGIGGFLGVSAFFVAEYVPELIQDDDMVEVVLEDDMDLEAPPPPPPPPPPPAAADSSDEEEEEEDEEVPDEMQEEVQELDEKVKEEIKSNKVVGGQEGGVEGGQEGGVVGGVIGGVVGGVLGGQLGGVQVFHHSELEVKKRVNPQYPDGARELNLGDQRCKARVFIDEKGVPYQVEVEDCPKVFHSTTKEAIMKWRWYPPKSGREKVKAQTVIAVTFKLRG